MDSHAEMVEMGRAKVDSKNIGRYLQGFNTTESGQALEGRKGDFAREIDLGEKMTGIIDRMVETPKEQSGEQGKVIYSIIKTGEIGETNMVTGSELEVDLKPALMEAINNGGLPLIVTHDHPNGYMFTPKDYLPLVSGDKSKSIRMTRAAVVLLPDKSQVMAVATNETPIYSSPEEAEKYLAGQDEELKGAIRGVAGDLGKNETEVVNEAARVTNSMQVAFANEMEVKLYRRVGRENFKEFSA